MVSFPTGSKRRQRRPWDLETMAEELKGGGAARFLQGGKVRDTGKRKGRGMRIKRRW